MVLAPERLVEPGTEVDWATRLASLPHDAALDVLAAMSPEDRVVVQRQIEDQDEWRHTPVSMAHHLSAGKIRRWRYAVLLGEKFRQAVAGESRYQIWNVPARYGKSMWASQWGPAWALDRYPWMKLILSSYGDDLARENAVAIKDILLEHPQLRANLRPDRRRADRFVTDEGGGVLAKGILSGITGYGGHGAVVDDPFKNWQEAHSRTVRDRVDNQFRSVIRLRLEGEASFIVVCHTRWHEDDLTARLLDRMEQGTGAAWDLVRLPAFAETWDPTSPDKWLHVPDLLGRRPGEVLEPERFSQLAVAERHRDIGSYLVAGMEQQRPAPAEGNVFKRDWWQYDGTRFDPRKGQADEWLSSWDFKLKDKTGGDYTVGQAWARTARDLWFFDQLRGQWNQAIAANAIALMSVRYPQIRRHVFENTGYGPEVAQALRTAIPDYVVSEEMRGTLGMTEDEAKAVQERRRRGLPGLVPNNPKGSKEVRAVAIVPYVEAGDVHVPPLAPWLPAFLEEVSAFTGTPSATVHDDQVDAMSQAVAKLHPVGRRNGTRGYGEEQRNTRATSVGGVRG